MNALLQTHVNVDQTTNISMDIDPKEPFRHQLWGHNQQQRVPSNPKHPMSFSLQRNKRRNMINPDAPDMEQTELNHDIKNHNATNTPPDIPKPDGNGRKGTIQMEVSASPESPMETEAPSPQRTPPLESVTVSLNTNNQQQPMHRNHGTKQRKQSMTASVSNATLPVAIASVELKVTPSISNNIDSNPVPVPVPNPIATPPITSTSGTSEISGISGISVPSPPQSTMNNIVNSPITDSIKVNGRNQNQNENQIVHQSLHRKSASLGITSRPVFRKRPVFRSQSVDVVESNLNTIENGKKDILQKSANQILPRNDLNHGIINESGSRNERVSKLSSNPIPIAIDTEDSNRNITSITGSPQLSKVTMSIHSMTSVPDPPQKNGLQFDNLVVASDEPEMLLQSGLNAISTAYKKHIDRIHQQLKRHQRVTFTSIQYIDEKLHALSTHKKQLKLSLATFTRNVNHKLDALEAHKNYIDTVHSKYTKAISTNFQSPSSRSQQQKKKKKKKGNSNMNSMNQKNRNRNGTLSQNLQCETCGHSARNPSELNAHLDVHRNDVPALSRDQWKRLLLQLIGCYRPQLDEFETKINESVLTLKTPLFPKTLTSNNNNTNNSNNPRHHRHSNASNPSTNRDEMESGSNTSNTLNTLIPSMVQPTSSSKPSANSNPTNSTIPISTSSTTKAPKPLRTVIASISSIPSVSDDDPRKTTKNVINVSSDAVPEIIEISDEEDDEPEREPSVSSLSESESSDSCKSRESRSEHNHDADHHHNNNTELNRSRNRRNHVHRETVHRRNRSKTSKPQKAKKSKKSNGSKPLNHDNHGSDGAVIDITSPSREVILTQNRNQNQNESDDIYPQQMEMKEVMKLKENALIDYRDFNGRFLKAKIMETEYDEKRDLLRFGVHYINWDHKWNVWSAPKFQFRRFAVNGTISQRRLHREEMNYVNLQNPRGQHLEVKPLHLYYHSKFKLQHQPNDHKVDRDYVPKYETWHVAECCLMDKYSAQVQCVLLRQNDDGHWFKPRKPDLYWVHLDNELECAPNGTHIEHPVILGEPQRERKKRHSVKRRKQRRNHEGSPPRKRQRRSTR